MSGIGIKESHNAISSIERPTLLSLYCRQRTIKVDLLQPTIQKQGIRDMNKEYSIP